MRPTKYLTIIIGLILSINNTSSQPLKILSYNILLGMELDTTNEKSIFTEWVKKMEPDILAIQEANNFTQKSLEKLAQKFNHPYAVIGKESGYPVAITSKYPIINIRKVNESMHHGFIQCQIKGFNIIVLHLSAHEYTRKMEDLKLILETMACHKSNNWILMGDFNSYSPYDSASYSDGKILEKHKKVEEKNPKSRNLVNGKLDYSVIESVLKAGYIDALKYKHKEFIATAQTKKYMLKNPTQGLFRIDYIFISNALRGKLISADVIVDSFTDFYSDHYPVSIELNVKH